MLVLGVCGAFLVLYLLVQNTRVSWDAGERSYILQNFDRYLTPVDPVYPVNHFFYFAHILELPAALVLKQVFGLSGLEAMRSLALLSAAVIWVSAALYVLRVSGSTLLSVLTVANIALAFSFWRFATSGEERLVQSATLLGFLVALERLLRREPEPGGALATGALGGIAIGFHLANLIVVPVALVGFALVWFQERSRPRLRQAGTTLAALAITTSAIVLPAAILSGVTGPKELFDFFTLYHSSSGIKDFFDPEEQSLGALLRLAFGGVSRVLTPVRSLFVFFVLLFAAITAVGCRGLVARRPLAAALGALTLIWSGHFLMYEPVNPESWLGLFVVVLVFCVAHVPARLHKPVAGLLSLSFLALVAFNSRSMWEWSRPTSHGLVVAALNQETGQARTVLLTLGGLQRSPHLHLDGAYEMRAFKSLAPSSLEIVSVVELMDPELTDVISLPAASVDDLRQWLASGVPVYCIDGAAALVSGLEGMKAEPWQTFTASAEDTQVVWRVEAR